MFSARSIAALALALLVGACASTPGKPDPAGPGSAVGGALSQPFRDLNLMREDMAVVLRAARESPYGPPASTDCAALAADIAALDAALGPDVDAPDHDKGASLIDELVSGAVSGVVGLPFRGVIRRVTGANSHEREMRRAALAGMARRSYLKGHRAAARCGEAQPAAQPVD